MLDQEIIKQRLRKDSLINQLNIANSILIAKHQELSELFSYQQDSLEDQCTRIEENSRFMQKRIEEVNAFCKDKFEQKKQIISNMNKHSGKKQALTLTFQNQNKKLHDAKATNFQIEEQIKFSRMQYEELQDQVFNLDIKGQNMKKFGMEIVPQEVAELINKKEELWLKNADLYRRVQAQRSGIDKMYTKNHKEQFKSEIGDLQLRVKKMNELVQQIRLLQIKSQELNEIKSKYQQNPILQIKQLQLSQQQQQSKLNNIEKQIASIRKRSAECLQKIQTYKVSQQQQDLRKSSSPEKIAGKDKVERSSRTKIYSQIKRQLEMEGLTKDQAVKESIRIGVKAKEQQNQTVILDQRTYRINKKVNLVQFWFLIVLFAVGLYFAQKIYKK